MSILFYFFLGISIDILVQVLHSLFLVDTGFDPRGSLRRKKYLYTEFIAVQHKQRFASKNGVCQPAQQSMTLLFDWLLRGTLSVGLRLINFFALSVTVSLRQLSWQTSDVPHFAHCDWPSGYVSSVDPHYVHCCRWWRTAFCQTEFLIVWWPQCRKKNTVLGVSSQ